MHYVVMPHITALVIVWYVVFLSGIHPFWKDM